jgi:hypothetical protein
MWKFACNSKGWTSNIHGLEWLRRFFEPATREIANRGIWLLICNGHDSHITSDFILHCLQSDIILLLLPPHSSHLLQPLDVGFFRPLKKYMSTELQRIINTGIHRLEKAEWLVVYARARKYASMPRNIWGG